ncbi:MAG: asparagine synthase (glutamine-hydrolyzing) [Deltaproteobacteria bacterium]|jgi:asparagine synthase (glutamine-hydrolysing)|nr:asparagine synthase (glutamine-hydrolyzing) [Deltaproteobacteria bacterium]
MCGISGFVGGFTKNDLQTMNQSMVHRGPDDYGTYFKNNVGLAHRRLSIIDVEGGHQPMSNEKNTIWIVFNGEIYNFQTLRKDHLKSYRFKTRSDTEVILHLYEKYGEKCIEYLRGMFAFAIWDENKQKLLIVRDRFGIKPLYYAQTGRGLIFASELKAILAIDAVPRKVDKEALNLYLSFRYVPGSGTMIDSIKKLEPAHSMVYQNGCLKISKYWDLSFDKDTGKSEEYYSQRLTELLKESIDIRLLSEVPLGAYLSGGLDSSFMVGLMSQIVHEPIKTFTAGFDGSWYDESPHAEIIAKEFNTDHHLLKTKADDVTILEKVIWHLDEPLADAATIPTYLLSQLTKKAVTVILSGEGADELLAGYDKYKFLFYAGKFSPSFFNPFFMFMQNIFKGNIKMERGFNLLCSKQRNQINYLDFAAVFTNQEKQQLLGPELKELQGMNKVPERIINKYLSYSEKGGDLLDRLLYLDIKTWLPNDVLLKNDKMTMAHSLEARVPFLDHKFAEFAMTIPNRLKLKWLTEKYILRQSMKGIVPDNIINRKKHGFTVPVAKWMQDGLKQYVEKLLNTGRITKLGYWNRSYVERLLKQDLSNQFYKRQFWTIITFEIWHRIFIEQETINI